MKVFDVINGKVHCEYPQYASASEAYKDFSPKMTFVDAPDNVWPGFGFDESKEGDDRFIRPELSEGWTYDSRNLPWNPEVTRAGEREAKHAETTNDTMQALRKIREGDTAIDWSAWLDELDAYNVAIEKTKEQADYPLKVVYPKYPTKPTH